MQVKTMEKGLAKVKEAAEYLGVSIAKVYLMMSTGELPFIKMGKSRRIEWEEVKNLVQRCKVAGKA